MDSQQSSQKPKRNYIAKNTFVYHHKPVFQLRERCQQQIFAEFATPQSVAKEAGRYTNMSYAAVSFSRTIQLSLAPIIQIVTEYFAKYHDFALFDEVVGQDRFVYLVISMKASRGLVAAKELARSVLHYCFGLNKESLGKAFENLPTHSMLNYDKCMEPVDTPFSHFLELNAGQCRTSFNVLLSNIMKFAQVPFNMFVFNGFDYSIKTRGDRVWSKLEQAKIIVIEALIDSLTTNASYHIHNLRTQNFNAAVLSKHPEIFNSKGELDMTKLPSFQKGFNAQIVTQEFIAIVMEVDKDEILAAYTQEQCKFIFENNIYRDVLNRLKLIQTQRLGEIMDKEFRAALIKIGNEHSLGKQLDMDSVRSVAYTCLNSFNIILSANFMPMQAYTYEQFFNFLRISVQMYKWMVKLGIENNADARQSIILWGASGSGKSLFPAVLYKYFSFAPFNIHAFFQNANLVQSSGFFIDEYDFSKLIEPTRCNQLKNASDPNGIWRVEVKHKESKIIEGMPPLIMNSNQDPRRPTQLRNTTDRAAYVNAIDPLDRRFKTIETNDTFRSKPHPQLGAPLHACFALSLLGIGQLICKDSVLSEIQPISYITYKGKSTVPPSQVIEEGLTRCIEKSNEPIVYLLSKDKALCQQLFQIIDTFEAKPANSITAAASAVRALFTSTKKDVQKLFQVNSLNNFTGVMMVDFEANDKQHAVGIEIAKALGEMKMNNFLKVLPTMFNPSDRQELAKLIDIPMNQQEKIAWVAHAQQWYFWRGWVDLQRANAERDARLEQLQNEVMQLKQAKLEDSRMFGQQQFKAPEAVVHEVQQLNQDNSFGLNFVFAEQHNPQIVDARVEQQSIHGNVIPFDSVSDSTFLNRAQAAKANQLDFPDQFSVDRHQFSASVPLDETVHGIMCQENLVSVEENSVVAQQKDKKRVKKANSKMNK